MINEQRADIHAFERRLKEILRNNEPDQQRWRVWLYFFATLFAIGAVLLYNDYQSYEERTIVEHLKNNKCFSFSAIVLLLLLVIFKAHERAVAKFILAERTRQVLLQFALSCDDEGNLRHCPKPPTNSSDEEFCSICSDEDEENDDLCIPEEEECNDIYYPYYNNN